MKFQACIGSGTMRVVHLRDTETTAAMNGDLVICEATSVFYDFKGVLDARKLCKKCVLKLYKQLPTGKQLEPATIGVARFFVSSDDAGGFL